uniref:Uncharacterized protein n=1 Tax=Pristionchus pacificus TaxID=54126 RepID=A0A2A6CE08_PRIPA|eukprot:PDM76283.1 hypothetical protein PRIPAC_39887 [Pristionchus pacificus]
MPNATTFAPRIAFEMMRMMIPLSHVESGVRNRHDVAVHPKVCATNATRKRLGTRARAWAELALQCCER